MKSLKKLFFSLCMLLLLSACEKERLVPTTEISWNSLGLEGLIIHKVQLFQDKIYAGTDKGFYVRNRGAENPDWELLGFENSDVQSFVIINENEMIISLVNMQNPQQTGLQKTTNGGESWTEYTNGFGGRTRNRFLI